MSDTATDTAPVITDTAPDGNAQDTQTTDTQDNTTQERSSISDGEQSGDFQLPDEYKEKSWAGKVKSHDDAYKQIENLTSLVGKKTIPPIDYDTATPEEIAAHHSSLAPEDVSAYEFSEGANPEVSAQIGEVFKEYGINKYQANGLSKKISEISAKMVEDQTKVDTSEESYMKMMEESFGDEYEKTVGAIEAVLKEHIKSDDDKLIFDKMDNTHRAAMDRTVHSISKAYEDRIKTILDKHGVTETSLQLEGDIGSNAGVNVDDVRSDIRNKISEISLRPHTQSEVQNLRNKLAATYK